VVVWGLYGYVLSESPQALLSQTQGHRF